MRFVFSIFVMILFCFCAETENKTAELIKKNKKLKIDSNIIKLKYAYADFIISVDSNCVILKDSTKMIFNDFKEKSFEQLLNNPDLEDHFFCHYPKNFSVPDKNQDPGRVRYEPFFKKMYGNSKQEVRKNLVKIIWLPKTLGKELWVTKINDVHKKLQAISDCLDTLDHLHKYVDNAAGTFYWRKISGTDRLSTHSFGIAIDINVKYSNYWKWEVKNSNDPIEYKNSIPQELVKIFEKYGFIWGGKWYHYDTMHFEYRPELL